MSAAEIERLVRELEVRQRELEHQNEELRRAQLELQQSRDRYTDLYEFAPVGYLTLAADGAVLEANLTAAAMLYVDRTTLIGTRLAEYCDHGSKAKLQTFLDAALASGERQCCEVKFIKDASFYALLEGGFISGTGGAMRCLVAMNDITSQKQAEEELRIRDRSFAASTNGILITDARQPDNPIVYCNPAFERMTGYSRDEIIGRNCRFLQADDRDQAERKEIRRAIKNGREVHTVLRNYRKDGTLFWNELHIAPVRDEQGELTHFVGIQNDITERVQAEQALTEKDKYLRLLVDSLPVLIGYVDTELRMQFGNAACEEWFGLPLEALKGRRMHDIVGEDLVVATEDKIADVLNGRRVEFETQLEHQQKGLRDVRFVFVPDAGPDGKVKGIQGLGIDITEQKIVEEQNARRRVLAERLAHLTSSERKVYELLIQGKSNGAIAIALDIGLRTVERRRHDILKKLQVESLAELLQQLADIQGIDPVL